MGKRGENGRTWSYLVEVSRSCDRENECKQQTTGHSNINTSSRNPDSIPMGATSALKALRHHCNVTISLSGTAHHTPPDVQGEPVRYSWVTGNWQRTDHWRTPEMHTCSGVADHSITSSSTHVLSGVHQTHTYGIFDMKARSSEWKSPYRSRAIRVLRH